MSLIDKELNKYQETAKRLITGNITKIKFSFEEMEYACIAYAEEIKNNNSYISVEILNASDENLTIKAGVDIFEIPTLEMFFTMKNLNRKELELILMSKNEEAFLTKFYFL
jgi:hypothetical protein